MIGPTRLGTFCAPLDITEGLLFWYALDEASGANAVDSNGGPTLTHVAGTLPNDVGTAAGVVGTSRTFATRSHFSSSDALFEFGDEDFFLSLFYYPTATGIHRILSKYNTSGNQRGYQITKNANAYTFSVNGTGLLSDDVVASTDTIYGAINTWYFVAVYHDSVANEIGISVTPISESEMNPYIVELTAEGVFNSSANFRLGTDHNELSTAIGRIDNFVGFSGTIPTTAVQDVLFKGAAFPS